MASPRGRQPHPLTTSSFQRLGCHCPVEEEVERSRRVPPAEEPARRWTPQSSAAGQPRTGRARTGAAKSRGEPRSGHPSPASALSARPTLSSRSYRWERFINKTLHKGESAAVPGAERCQAPRRHGPGAPAPSQSGKDALSSGGRPENSGHLPPERSPHSLAPARTHLDGAGQRSAEPRCPCPTVQSLPAARRRYRGPSACTPARSAPPSAAAASGTDTAAHAPRRAAATRRVLAPPPPCIAPCQGPAEGERPSGA